MDLTRLIDVGLIVTGPAAVAAFGWGKERWPGSGRWLRHLLLMSWVASAFCAASVANMATVVLVAVLIDAAIAFAAVAVLTNDRTRNDARTVGVISLALMPAHLTVSIYEGLTYQGWALYAGGCNAAFIAQCLIMRGWLDGLGRTIAGFFGRVRSLPLLRFRGR
jgi:hypothetical protein